jgi:preprotein translocase subunit YajC
MNYPQVGQKVVFNGGFFGTIIKVCEWADNKMIEIRNSSGVCCIPVEDARPA